MRDVIIGLAVGFFLAAILVATCVIWLLVEYGAT